MKLSDQKKKILLSLFKQFKSNRYAPYVNFYDLADDIVKERDYYETHGHLRLKHSACVSIRRSLNRLLRDKLVCVEKKYVGGSLLCYSLTNRGLATARNIRSEIVRYIDTWNKFVKVNR